MNNVGVRARRGAAAACRTCNSRSPSLSLSLSFALSLHSMGLVTFFAMPLVLCGMSFTAFVVATVVRCIYKRLGPMVRRKIRLIGVVKALNIAKYTTGSALTATLKLIVTTCLFIYPGMCNKFFTTFKCIELNDNDFFMVADMSVQCYQASWFLWASLAIVGMVLFVVGIPLAILIVLYISKKSGTLQYPSITDHPESISVSELQHNVRRTNAYFRNRVAFGNVYAQYDLGCWWFEFACVPI